MTIDALEGRTFGARPYRLCSEKVTEFVVVTGDDHERWTDTAPPGFAAALLFVVAPDLLADPMVDGPVVHGEQRFTWHRPLTVGAAVLVEGTVDRVRRRGETAFIGFDMLTSDDEGPLLEGRSTFLVGPAGTPAADVEPPPVYERAANLPVDTQLPSPRSASRTDLVRYAGATRDWNPIHWDHASAQAAGLGGVVVHGLLQSGWLTQVAAAARPGSSRPLASARHRYRATLRPGAAAQIDGSMDDAGADLEVSADGVVTTSSRFEFAA